MGVLNWFDSDFSIALYKLVLAATVYYIWGKRNARILSNTIFTARDVDAVFRNIEREVRDRSCYLALVENSLKNWLLCLSWNIPTRILKVARH